MQAPCLAWSPWHDPHEGSCNNSGNLTEHTGVTSDQHRSSAQNFVQWPTSHTHNVCFGRRFAESPLVGAALLRVRLNLCLLKQATRWEWQIENSFAVLISSNYIYLSKQPNEIGEKRSFLQSCYQWNLNSIFLSKQPSEIGKKRLTLVATPALPPRGCAVMGEHNSCSLVHIGIMGNNKYTHIHTHTRWMLEQWVK
jgi:hypothetical protein